MDLNQKKPKIFYGWWIVAALFVMAMFRVGVIGHGFTAVFEPIVEEFGWSYTKVSLASSLRGVETGLLAPLMGMLVDRFGPRRMIFIGGIVIAAGLFYLSRTNSLVVFYTAFALIAIGSSAGSGTVSGTAIANWFDKKMGLATGIMACGSGFGGLMIPIIVNLVDTYDWRTALAILSIGALILFLPLSLLIRHKPEQYGYLPDGINAQRYKENKEKARETIEINLSTKQALKSRSYWHIVIAYLFHHLVHNAISTHIMPYLSTIGIARSAASFIAMGLPMISMIGRFGFGLISVRFRKHKKWLIAICLIMESLSMLLFVNISGSVFTMTAFMLLNGIGWGGLIPLRAVMLREYFGRVNFGTILGFLMGVEMLGNVIGSPLAGWTYDTTGSYETIWLIYGGLVLIGLFIILTIPSSKTSAVEAGAITS
ncbi:MFS transporter [Chloroflexota bacterium]